MHSSVSIAPAAALTASDWFAFFGVIVAAVLGVVVAVWGQWRARVAAERDSLNAALASVILALGDRALELQSWVESPKQEAGMSLRVAYFRNDRRESVGGPIDARLQTVVEAAWLLAKKRRDLRCIAALADAVYHLKAAPVGWQIARIGQVAASVRAWRTGSVKARQFETAMQAHREAAHAAAPTEQLSE